MNPTTLSVLLGASSAGVLAAAAFAPGRDGETWAQQALPSGKEGAVSTPDDPVYVDDAPAVSASGLLQRRVRLWRATFVDGALADIDASDIPAGKMVASDGRLLDEGSMEAAMAWADYLVLAFWIAAEVNTLWQRSLERFGERDPLTRELWTEAVRGHAMLGNAFIACGRAYRRSGLSLDAVPGLTRRVAGNDALRVFHFSGALNPWAYRMTDPSQQTQEIRANSPNDLIRIGLSIQLNANRHAGDNRGIARQLSEQAERFQSEPITRQANPPWVVILVVGALAFGAGAALISMNSNRELSVAINAQAQHVVELTDRANAVLNRLDRDDLTQEERRALLDELETYSRLTGDAVQATDGLITARNRSDSMMQYLKWGALGLGGIAVVGFVFGVVIPAAKRRDQRQRRG